MTTIQSTPQRRKVQPIISEASLTPRQKLIAIEKQLNSVFVQREEVLRSIIVANLCGLNYILVGGHGTGKTALADCFAQHIAGASYFSPSALGAYTTLGDLIGERDIPALMQGESKRRIEGKLGAVNLAFLDEIMKASDPTVNMLLSVLNERRIEGQETPLWSVGSATNWPEVHAMKPTVAAFWDRLHIRIIVEEVTQAAAVKELLKRGRLLAKTPYVSQTKITLDEIKSCKQVIRDVQIPDIIEDLLVSISARLADQKVFISSRRLVQFQFILQAHAWMDGRDVVNVTDFNRLTWCCWTKKDDISKITSVLSTCDAALVQSLNETINAARKMYADYSRIGMTHDRAQEFIVFASDVAIRVADIVGAKNLTVTSKKDVIRAVKLLKYEVEQVILKYGETLGL